MYTYITGYILVEDYKTIHAGRPEGDPAEYKLPI